MDERLNQQNIIELLIEKNGLDRKTAGKFVKEFFLLIKDSLEKDKIVKIKGLGTFKLIQVESRESVNINTGDRFVIEGYNKITFTPDSNIKNSINQPFAHFETVELNENTVIDDIETEEENGTFDNEAIEDVLEDNIPEATPSEDSNIEIVEIDRKSVV